MIWNAPQPQLALQAPVSAHRAWQAIQFSRLSELYRKSVKQRGGSCLRNVYQHKNIEDQKALYCHFVPESYSFSCSTPTSILKCARRIQKARNSSTVPWSKVAIWAMVIPCHPFVGQTSVLNKSGVGMITIPCDSETTPIYSKTFHKCFSSEVLTSIRMN